MGIRTSVTQYDGFMLRRYSKTDHWGTFEHFRDIETPNHVTGLTIRFVHFHRSWQIRQPAAQSKQSSLSQGFAHFVRTSLPACGGALQNTIKNRVQVNLTRFFIVFCGERGIRTPGPVKINGFQDRRIRPLCHLSSLEPKRELLPLVVVPFCKGLQRYEYFRNLQIIFHFFLLLSRRICTGRAKDRLLRRLHSCRRS